MQYDENRSYYIAGIDPGTTTIGFVVFKVELFPFKILAIYPHLFDMSLTGVYGTENENIESRLKRLNGTIREAVEFYQVDAIGIESGFIYNKRPTAIIPLTKALHTIETAAIEGNPFIYIRRFAPKYIKRVATKDGTADKDSVLNGVLGIKTITDHVDPTRLSEHEVDGLAIAYTLFEFLKTDDGFFRLL